MGRSRFRQLRPAIIIALAFAAGCATVEDATPTLDATAEIEQWKCGDYTDGCGFLSTDCVTLTANLRNGTGEVKFSRFVDHTRFQVQGIERRWDWCLTDDDSYDCAFVVSVNGTGRYYNFRGSDERESPTNHFKCTKL